MNNPNATKNLKKWEKGKSGNPKGRPRLDERYKAIKKLSQETIERVISDLLEKPIEELKALHLDPNASALEHLLIAEIIRGNKQSGSLSGLNSLIDRLHGKAKATIDASLTTNIIYADKQDKDL